MRTGVDPAHAQARVALAGSGAAGRLGSQRCRDAQGCQVNVAPYHATPMCLNPKPYIQGMVSEQARRVTQSTSTDMRAATSLRGTLAWKSLMITSCEGGQ